MAVALDVLHLFPDLAAIGRSKVQDYCNAWVQRPISRGYAIAQIVVDDQLLMYIRLGATGATFAGDRAFFPIDELLGYIVDRHFADADKRRELHATIRDTRRRWAELGRHYALTVGRRGTFFITCKNPDCRAELETSHQGVEGQTVECPPTDVTCPVCGSTHTYDGRDLHLG